MGFLGPPRFSRFALSSATPFKATEPMHGRCLVAPWKSLEEMGFRAIYPIYQWRAGPMHRRWGDAPSPTLPVASSRVEHARMTASRESIKPTGRLDGRSADRPENFVSENTEPLLLPWKMGHALRDGGAFGSRRERRTKPILAVSALPCRSQRSPYGE